MVSVNVAANSIGVVSTGANPAASSQNYGRFLNVLFLCRDNTVASIMAEAILNRCGGPFFRAFSAGSRAGRSIDPLAVEIMKSQRVWGEDLKVKGCESFFEEDAPRMDFIISVGERTPEGLPSRWPGNPRVMHWRISDPLVDGDLKSKVRALRKTFGELDTRIRLFTLVNGARRNPGKIAA